MRWWLAWATLCALIAPTMLMAATAVDVQQLERELRCPTCNAPLAVSDSPAADEIKQFIRDRAARGDSPEQIKQALVEEFGREVLADPPKEGFDLFAWLVPIVAVLAGLVAIPFITRAWSRRSRRAASPTSVDASPDELSRLDEELRRRG